MVICCSAAAALAYGSCSAAAAMTSAWSYATSGDATPAPACACACGAQALEQPFVKRASRITRKAVAREATWPRRSSWSRSAERS